MGLGLTTIAIFVLIAIGYAMLVPPTMRPWVLFSISVGAIFVLQPDIFVRWLDFFLPLLMLVLVGISWFITRADNQTISRIDWQAGCLIILIVLALGALRYAPPDWRWLLPSRPPPMLMILLLVLFVAGIGYAIGRTSHKLTFLLLIFIGLFIILKTEPLAITISHLLRSQTGQDVALASVIDLNWLGFSYVAFRLIHTIRDRQSGLLPELSLRDYVTYVLFFPAIIAGPIDRAERFLIDLQALSERLVFSERFVTGITRISIGLGKKFIIADSLAQGMALNTINVTQIETTLGAWLLLYGYALRLYFDFSGYTDIAIGIGILFGITLPENFKQPYTRTSITAFWQSWHITLSNWVRFYVFSPLSRYLLKRKPKPSPVLIVFTTQLATMIVIGLWHGVTLNFLIWGLWHGLGLFVHKRWADRTRLFYRQLRDHPRRQRVADGIAWFLTFHFVVLGWVWFALATPMQALLMFANLFGVS